MTKRKNPAAVALGALGGAANTDAQRLARQKNAKRAYESQHNGRPARVCRDCDQRVIAVVVWGTEAKGTVKVALAHRDARLDKECKATGWRWRQRSETPVP